MDISFSFVLLVGICLVLSFWFSGMETGVLALNRLRIRQQMRAGRRRAYLLHGYLQNPEDFLWTILIGNTLATFTAFAMIVVALNQAFNRQPLAFVALFLGLAFLFYMLCDLLPKMLFRQFPTRLCLVLAVPFRFIHLALSPLVALMTRISNGLLGLTGGKSYKGHVFGDRTELRWVTQDSGFSLTTEERAMINRVLDLQNATVRSVAVPISKVISIHTGTPFHEVLAVCKEQGLSRLPVWEGDGKRRRIVGIVSLKTFVYEPEIDPQKPAGALVKPALYLREDLRLEEALLRLQRSGQRMAIVLSLDQIEIGIVSLQDILRHIFGEVSL